MQQTASTTSTSSTAHTENEKSQVLETTEERVEGSSTDNEGQNLEYYGKSKEVSGDLREKVNDAESKKATQVEESKDENQVAQSASGENDEPDEEVEDDSKYISGFKLAILTTGLCLVTFIIALDNTIIATAIPKITTVFNSLDDVGWYGSSYLLTTTSLQPSLGKVYTYFDVKYTYLAAVVVFEVGSIICAAATSSPMFIIGRTIAGAGAAGLYSGGMNIIAFSVPLRKRAIYIASLASMFGIASVVGPILGGAFTDRISWRWCFWINLPLGAISIAVVFFFFSNPERRYSHLTVKERIKHIDIAGAIFLICAIVCLLLALQWGGFTYPWKDSKVWGTLLGFGLLITIFIIIQVYQGDRATIPIRVFKQQTVLVSCIYTVLLAMALYA